MRAPTFKGNVIISNIPSELTPAELADMFDEFGLVLGAKIDRWHDRPGGSKGMVDLAPDTAVDKAIEGLSGKVVDGTKITVRRAPKPERPKSPPKADAPRRPSPSISSAIDSFTKSSPTLASRPPMPSRSPSTDFPASVAPSRQVVVEYRAPRRVVLPPRTPKAADDAE